VTYRDRQRLADIQAAIDAIRSHLQRGTLTDGWSSTPSDPPARNRRGRQGAACWPPSPAIPWRQITRMGDHLAHRYFDTAHTILQATVDDDLAALERAVRALAQALPPDDETEHQTSVE